jgi:hypothetical protein
VLTPKPEHIGNEGKGNAKREIIFLITEAVLDNEE